MSMWQAWSMLSGLARGESVFSAPVTAHGSGRGGDGFEDVGGRTGWFGGVSGGRRRRQAAQGSDDRRSGNSTRTDDLPGWTPQYTPPPFIVTNFVYGAPSDSGPRVQRRRKAGKNAALPSGLDLLAERTMVQTPAQAQTLYNHVRTVAFALDKTPALRGIPLDAVLSFLVPFTLGDLLGVALGVYLVLLCLLFPGLPLAVTGRMAVYLAIDYVVGAIPIVGGLLDWRWRANLMNLELLEKWLDGEAAQWKVATVKSRTY
ncbi:hypothetical protein PYCC9005_000962 [Savitreella phatthalungensis]